MDIAIKNNEPLGMLMALVVEPTAFKVSEPDPTPPVLEVIDVDDISGVEVRLSLGLGSLVTLLRGSRPALLVADESPLSLLLAFPIIGLGEDCVVVDGDEGETGVAEAVEAAVVELNT